MFNEKFSSWINIYKVYFYRVLFITYSSILF
jgi:hypothetical protein